MTMMQSNSCAFNTSDFPMSIIYSVAQWTACSCIWVSPLWNSLPFRPQAESTQWRTPPTLPPLHAVRPIGKVTQGLFVFVKNTSFATPPGPDRGGVHSLVCQHWFDVLILWLPDSAEEVLFSVDPMEKCHCLPNAMISALAISWVSTEGRSV